jgi:hypothetical protein
MTEEPIPTIAEKKCPDPDCNEWNLVYESTMTSGDVSPMGEIKEDEKYTIYRCDKCGARYKIKEN